MTRLSILLFSIALIFSAPSPARAVEIDTSMTWELGMGWADNTQFLDAGQGDQDDAFSVMQRIRPQFNFIASETLAGVLEFESYLMWGSNEAEGGGGAINADQVAFSVRRSYLDWYPADKFTLRMGVQGVALPSAAFGSPVLDADVAGVLASYTFTENVALTGFWLRPFDGDHTTGNEMDMFGLVLPLASGAFTLTPWGIYARNNNASEFWNFRYDEENMYFQGSSDMWWAGTASELSVLDLFEIRLDAMYGSSESGKDAPEYAGWLVAGLFEFRTESRWGKPGLLGWYASGDDGDAYGKNGGNGGFGRMPVVSTDRAGFAPTAYGFAGSAGCMQDSLLSNSPICNRLNTHASTTFESDKNASLSISLV